MDPVPASLTPMNASQAMVGLIEPGEEEDFRAAAVAAYDPGATREKTKDMEHRKDMEEEEEVASSQLAMTPSDSSGAKDPEERGGRVSNEDGPDARRDVRRIDECEDNHNEAEEDKYDEEEDALLEGTQPQSGCDSATEEDEGREAAPEESGGQQHSSDAIEHVAAEEKSAGDMTGSDHHGPDEQKFGTAKEAISQHSCSEDRTVIEDTPSDTGKMDMDAAAAPSVAEELPGGSMEPPRIQHHARSQTAANDNVVEGGEETIVEQYSASDESESGADIVEEEADIDKDDRDVADGHESHDRSKEERQHQQNHESGDNDDKPKEHVAEPPSKKRRRSHLVLSDSEADSEDEGKEEQGKEEEEEEEEEEEADFDFEAYKMAYELKDFQDIDQMVPQPLVWKDLWDRLRSKGWTWRPGTLTTYRYLRPGKSLRSSAGVDFFHSMGDTVQYICKIGEARGWRTRILQAAASAALLLSMERAPRLHQYLPESAPLQCGRNHPRYENLCRR